MKNQPKYTVISNITPERALALVLNSRPLMALIGEIIAEGNGGSGNHVPGDVDFVSRDGADQQCDCRSQAVA